jgi:hypothetical protein
VVAEVDPDLVLAATASSVAISEALVEFNEVRPETAATFHYHGDPELLPLSAVLVFPADAKEATLVKARINGSTKASSPLRRSMVSGLSGHRYAERVATRV